MGCESVVIMGAGGKDFHVFNSVFKNNPAYRVVAFTASQIPGIERRIYPPKLAGKLYPSGIPIIPEEELPRLLRNEKVDTVILAYSDLSHMEVMHKAAWINSMGPSFKLLGVEQLWVRAEKPVIAVCGTSTGAGKSTVAKEVLSILEREFALRGVVVRHPMTYGDFERSVVVRVASVEDLVKRTQSLEEVEEAALHVRNGHVVYYGIDYVKIAVEAAKEGDFLVWDGGNNDVPLLKPDVYITVLDVTREEDLEGTYPGEVNLRLADIIVVNKSEKLSSNDKERILERLEQLNGRAAVVFTGMEVEVDNPSAIRGRRVAVVEDSPTVTHGGRAYAAGYVAALKYGAREIVDPRPYAKGELRELYERYPHLGRVVPSLGYTGEQLQSLRETLVSMPCEAIVLGTPAPLRKLLDLPEDQEVVHVEYRLIGVEEFRENLLKLLEKRNIFG